MQQTNKLADPGSPIAHPEVGKISRDVLYLKPFSHDYHVHVHVVVRKKDHRNKKTSHLILEMSMNEAFIWLSGHRFIDREICNG